MRTPGVFVARNGVVVGVSGGEVAGGTGLLIAGAAIALVAIPLYKRAMAAIYEHQAMELANKLEANRVAFASLTNAHAHAKAQHARYKRKG